MASRWMVQTSKGSEKIMGERFDRQLESGPEENSSWTGGQLTAGWSWGAAVLLTLPFQQAAGAGFQTYTPLHLHSSWELLGSNSCSEQTRILFPLHWHRSTCLLRQPRQTDSERKKKTLLFSSLAFQPALDRSTDLPGRWGEISKSSTTHLIHSTLREIHLGWKLSVQRWSTRWPKLSNLLFCAGTLPLSWEAAQHPRATTTTRGGSQ